MRLRERVEILKECIRTLMLIVIRVALIIGSVIGIGRYWDIPNVLVLSILIILLTNLPIDDIIILGQVILVSKDGSKHMKLGVQHLSANRLGVHSVRTKR